MGIKCCLKCTDERHPACWDTCTKYAEEKQKDEAVKEAQRKDNMFRGYVHERQMESKSRWQKNMYRRAGSAKSWMGGE